MKLIVCPDVYDQKNDEYSIFMAGGITGCPNWQLEVMSASCYSTLNSELGGLGKELVLVNPRRASFDCSKAESSEEQIKWEFEHLQIVDAIYFWFPKEGACAITLFELGYALGSNRNIKVGVEPGYARELDVYTQFGLRRPNQHIYNTVHSLYSINF